MIPLDTLAIMTPQNEEVNDFTSSDPDKQDVKNLTSLHNGANESI